MMVKTVRALVALFCAVATGAAFAAAWPERPVRIIVTSQPGGGSDTTFRVLAPKLTEYLGQQVVVENRAGVSGNIGAEAIARAAPDGYTLGTLFSSHTSNVAVMKNVPFDLIRDFTPITNAVTMPNLLTSHPSVPAKTLKELVDIARRSPNKLSYASGGIGSTPHLSGELFRLLSGITLVHVRFHDRLPAPVLRTVLQGDDRRYDRLVDWVTETEGNFRDDLLAGVPVVDLLVLPISEIADRWRS
mgnify:CR=1 FL=1